MTMTAFITRCWRSARLDLSLLLICAGLGWVQPRLAHADAGAVEISQFKLDAEDNKLMLSALVSFGLPHSVEDALHKGVALFFVAEATVFQDRWYWFEKKVITTERHMRLAYQPLSRRWRLSLSHAPVASMSPQSGLTLTQNFDSLEEALASIQRLTRWKIADAALVEPGSSYNVVFNFRLDLSHLARPLQIGALGKSDWQLAASLRRKWTLENAK